MNFKFKTQPERVSFKEKGHKYTGKSGHNYTSVTTLLKEYHKEFDSDYWSDYKAVKDILLNAGGSIWYRYKQAAGGWEGVVAHYLSNRNQLDVTIRNQILARKQKYLDDWDYEREHAAKLGTMHHNDLESLLLNTPKILIAKERIANVSPADLLDLQGFTEGEHHVHPELLLWNEKYRIAGQADVVERDGKYVHIKDYKTCKKIEFEPFMGARMYEPLDELPDMNYSKFTMQLSTYGWMLEQIGYEVIGCTMIHINRETGEHQESYPLAYRKDLVIKMLEDHDSKRT
jgi:hypothetical protein